MRKSLLRRLFEEVKWTLNFVFWLVLGTFVLLVVYSVLPGSMQVGIVETALKIMGKETVTTTGIHSTIEEFQHEPKLIIGYQIINDSIIRETKKPFCDPAFYKVFVTRKADWIYDITDGVMEIKFTTENVEFHDSPVRTGQFCNYEAPKLSAEELSYLQDSLELRYNLSTGYSEEDLKDLVTEYIKKDYIKWRQTLKP